MVILGKALRYLLSPDMVMHSTFVYGSSAIPKSFIAQTIVLSYAVLDKALKPGVHY